MNRFPFIKQWLVDNQWATKEEVNSLTDLFTLWEKYVNAPTEGIPEFRLYDSLKVLFVLKFGETWFYDLLQNTYFFHQTRWLLERGITTYFQY